MNRPIARWLLPLMLITALTYAQSQKLQKSVSGSGYSKTANHNATISGTFGQAIVGSVRGTTSTTSEGFWTDGNASATGIKPGQFAPRNITLLSNAPNPFNHATTIRFTLASQKDIALKVFAMNGDLVNTTRFLQCNAGPNEYVFPRRALPSGNYNYTLSDGTSLTTGAMTITK